eukprot:gnl/TRDRNA2_/TRDRNA2_146984_c0_seq1.p1 gnl/TRDRNA2_/TRDRNA2_146984_c0~~gnl/TRDRNA2_/TRDRNA2_146984_c0_seq1.p1  ORF type:complete len:350 (+),score=53.16 gnl/TRDRNA2_/TRDRNA2_146984_c0_seq1:67-1116(+)
MPLEDIWLKPLEEPLNGASSRSHTIALADKEGVHLFSEEEAAAAAEHFHKHGFVVLLNAVSGDALKNLQQASAQLIRQAVERLPGGNRGAQRWSLGRTTADKCYGRACVEPADNKHICSVLSHIRRSEKFTLLCTGGDFSLPGAAMQEMHADIGKRKGAGEYYAFDDFLKLPAATVKIYLTMTEFDEATGPPVFVPGSHLRFLDEDVPKDDPENRKYAYCPSGSAIIMDMRVWHHGSPNKSQVARPMLSLHYAAPWYNENVMTMPNQYWTYHRGALSRATLLGMRPRARQLCCHLVYQQCETCHCPADNAEPLSGWFKGWWYCESCWSEWEQWKQQERERSPRRPSDHG